MSEIALLTGSLPPEICGVGDYTKNLHDALTDLVPVELVHAPIKRPTEPAIFKAFGGRSLVHVQYPTEGWGNSLLPTFLGVGRGRAKLLLTLHEWSRMNPLRRASIRPLVARADGFIFVSESERRAFGETAPPQARQKPSWVIPIGVNLTVPDLSTENIMARRDELLKPDRDFLLTHFGFIHAGKQPTKLLDLVQALKEKGRKPRLVFVGDFQKDKAGERTEFQAQIESRNLGQEVKMLGFVQDDHLAATTIAASDLNISLFDDGLSPRRGSFWYTAQLGCPLLTTIPSDMREFADREFREHVRFVGADCSTSDLVNAALQTPDFKPKRHRPMEVASWQSIARQHKAVYEEMLG